MHAAPEFDRLGADPDALQTALVDVAQHQLLRRAAAGIGGAVRLDLQVLHDLLLRNNVTIFKLEIE